MKCIKTMVLVVPVLFFVTGTAYAVDMDDLGVTIKMIDSDDMKGASSELHLPAAASDMAREQAGNRDGKGLSRANESRNRNDSGDQEGHDHRTAAKDKMDAQTSSQEETHGSSMDSHDEVRNSQTEMHDETKDTQEYVKDEQNEAHQDTNDDHTENRDTLESNTDDPSGNM